MKIRKGVTKLSINNLENAAFLPTFEAENMFFFTLVNTFLSWTPFFEGPFSKQISTDLFAISTIFKLEVFFLENIVLTFLHYIIFLYLTSFFPEFMLSISILLSILTAKSYIHIFILRCFVCCTYWLLFLKDLLSKTCDFLFDSLTQLY